MIKTLLIIITGMFCMLLQAQQAVSTTAGNLAGGGGTVSYTVGQIFYITTLNSNGSVVQGVQQPYEISVITELEDAGKISVEFTVYPNPTSDYLILKITGDNEKGCSASLYDINGNMLRTQKVVTNETTFSMQNNLPGTYFLKIVVKPQNSEALHIIKTFKIIKN